MATVLPNNDLSIMKVRNTLGYPSMDLGTLCTNGKINKWSRYKPVRYAFDSTYPEGWWKSDSQDKNCGIGWKRYKNFYDVVDTKGIIDEIKRGVELFPYEYPLGGKDNPYRLGDFRSYFHDALPPIYAGNYDRKIYTTKGQNAKIFFVPSIRSSSNRNYELFITEIFGNIPELYYGAGIQLKTPSIQQPPMYWMTSETPIDPNNPDVVKGIEFPINSFGQGGKFRVYQFLTTKPSPSGVLMSTANDRGGNIWEDILPLPTYKDVPYEQTIQLVEKDYTIGFSKADLFRYRKANVYDKITAQIRVENRRGSDIHIGDISLEWRYQENALAPNIKPSIGEGIKYYGESRNPSGVIVIPALSFVATVEGNVPGEKGVSIFDITPDVIDYNANILPYINSIYNGVKYTYGVLLLKARVQINQTYEPDIEAAARLEVTEERFQI